MTAPPSASGIPPAIDGDDDDVAWALQTAQVQWNRGAHADAIVWLERAVETAIEKGATDRAAFLNRATNAVRASLEKPGPSPNPFLSPAPAAPNPFLNQSPAAPNPFLDRTPSRPPVAPSAPPRPSPPSPPPPPPPTPAPPATSVAISEASPDSAELLDAVDDNDSDDDSISAPVPAVPWPMPAQSSPPAARPVPSPAPVMPAPPTAPPFASPPATPPPAPAGPARPPPPPRLPPPPKRPPPRRESPLPSFAEPEAEVEAPPPHEEDRLPAFARSDSAPPSAGSDRLPSFERPPSAPPAKPRTRPSLEPGESIRPPSEERELLPYERESVPDQEPAPVAVVAGIPIPADLEPAIERTSALSALTEAPSEDESSSATAEPGDSADEPEAPSAEPTVILDGVSLAEVSGLEDLPEEAQQELVRRARIESLNTDEEVSDFAVGLVLAGTALIMPEIADATCARIPRGSVVFTTGSLKAGIPLRAVAAEDGTRVAVWSKETLDEVTADCPWVADELRQVADRYQALAGVTMGVMGDRLDDALRALVTERCEVRRLLPHEVLLKQNAKVGGLYVVGAGRIELCDTEDDEAEVLDELGPGDFLFAPQVLSAGTAPNVARACKQGALILFADRMTAHELMLSVPPLLEILSG